MSSLLSLSSEEEQREREREYVRFVVSNEKKTKRVFPSLSLSVCLLFESSRRPFGLQRERCTPREEEAKKRNAFFCVSLFQVDTLEVVRYSI